MVNLLSAMQYIFGYGIFHGGEVILIDGVLVGRARLITTL